MKRALVFLACIIAVLGCSNTSDIRYTELEHYFFKVGKTIPDNPKIATAEEFTKLFGMSVVMGENGKATPINWAKEFVIAVVNPVTDLATELTPESLSLVDGELVFTYHETVGEPQRWTMQPVLLVKVNRKYETETVRLEKKQ